MRRRVHKAAPGALEIEPISGRAAIPIKKALQVMRPRLYNRRPIEYRLSRPFVGSGSIAYYRASFRLANGPDMTRLSPLPAAASAPARLAGSAVAVFRVDAGARAEPRRSACRRRESRSGAAARAPSRTIARRRSRAVRTRDPRWRRARPPDGWGRRGKSWRQFLLAPPVPVGVCRRFLGAMLFSPLGGMGHVLGGILQFLIIGLLIFLAIRLAFAAFSEAAVLPVRVTGPAAEVWGAAKSAAGSARGRCRRRSRTTVPRRRYDGQRYRPRAFQAAHAWFRRLGRTAILRACASS